MITVKVAGELKGMGEFTPVKVTELVATTWAMGDRAGRVVPGRQGRGAQPEGVRLMERFFGIVLLMMVALMLLGFVLAHFGLVLIIVLAVGLIGRHLRRHGV